jgi:hypothetical protein
MVLILHSIIDGKAGFHILPVLYGGVSGSYSACNIWQGYSAFTTETCAVSPSLAQSLSFRMLIQSFPGLSCKLCPYST